MFIGIFGSEQLMCLGLICNAIGTIFLGAWGYLCVRIRDGRPEVQDSKNCECLDRILKPLGLFLFFVGFSLQFCGHCISP